MANCPKCGGEVRHSIIEVTAEYVEDAQAVVKMRSSVIIATEKGPQRLNINERVSLPYMMIASILDAEALAVLYFIEELDKLTFLSLYPRFSEWKL